MPVLINGITCGELVKGYSESVSEGKVLSTKRYICLWEQRIQVAQGLLGFSSGTRHGGTIFHPPTRHPDLTGIVAKSIRIEPVGRPYDGPRQAAWASAIITAEFGSLDWPAIASDDPAGDQSIDPDTKFLYCTQDIDYGMETYTIPGSALQYISAGGLGSPRPFPHDKVIRVQHAELGLNFSNLPYMPVNFIPLIDKLNAAKFLGGKRGTVKFNGGKTHREYQSDGSITQSVTMSFSYRPNHDWNEVPDPTGPTKDWVPLSFQNGDPIFAYTDLSVVFPPGYAY